MRTIKLKSPYGYMTTPGGGRIENGRVGVQTYGEADRFVFEGETVSLPVPAHWQEPVRVGIVNSEAK